MAQLYLTLPYLLHIWSSHPPNQISLWGPHDPMNGTPRSHLIEYHSVWNWITMDHSTKITAIYCQHNLQCTTYSSHCSSTRFNWWFLTLHNQLSLLVYQWLSKDVFRALIRWAFQQQASQTSLTLELLMNRTLQHWAVPGQTGDWTCWDCSL